MRLAREAASYRNADLARLLAVASSRITSWKNGATAGCRKDSRKTDNGDGNGNGLGERWQPILSAGVGGRPPCRHAAAPAPDHAGDEPAAAGRADRGQLPA